ncbi:MAG: DUF1461 domain-containing protein [Patescibacteria group bacterium]
MKISQYLLIIFLPITIILCNLLPLVYSNSFYTTIYKKENIYQNFRSTIEVDNATKELVSYFRGQNNLDGNFYSTQSILHLTDVKNIFDALIIINALSILSAFAAFLYLNLKKKRSVIRKSLILGCIVATCFVLIAFILSLLNFDAFFVYFHKVLFRNDLWLFNQNDNLIKLFPIEFFIAFTKQLTINILISVLLILSVAHLLPKHDSTTI